MDISSDDHIDTELPSSPLDLPDIAPWSTPNEEDGDDENDISTLVNGNEPTNVNAILNSQRSNNSSSSQKSSNKRVYEVNQNGRLKLKISLKGLHKKLGDDNDKEDDNDDNSNTRDNTQDTMVSSAETMTLNRENSTHTDTLSQNANPPDTNNNNNNNNHDDSFSDDIDLSEIDSHSVQILELSPSISVMKRPNSYTLSLKLTPEMKEKLENDAYEKRKNMLIESKRQQAKEKFAAKQKEREEKAKAKAKAKPKRRLKPLHSRLMVSMDKIPVTSERGMVYMSNMLKMKAKGIGNTNDGKNNNNNEEEEEEDELMEQKVRLSLKDPISGSRLVTPMRSIFCSHVECFDYDSFLAMYNLKPFKMAIQRYSTKPTKVGEVDILKILEDTKRPVLSINSLEQHTRDYDYNSKLATLKDNNKPFNELEWFRCPICKLEFNIKKLGDLYCVGEFVDLLQDIKFEDHNEDIEAIEIDLSQGGKWRYIHEDETDIKFGRTTATTPAPIPQDQQQQNTGEVNPMERSQSVIETHHHNIEVVTLDSDDEQESGTAAENMINTLRPIMQESNNGEMTEAEIDRRLDELFDAEILDGGDTYSTPSSSSVGPPSYSNFAKQPYITRFINNDNIGGSFTKNMEVNHPGVVAFRPGAFTTTDLDGDDAMPVFMSGEGAADDPIVLD